MRGDNTCPNWLIFSHGFFGTFERYKSNRNKQKLRNWQVYKSVLNL